jgi:hypothetical protein
MESKPIASGLDNLIKSARLLEKMGRLRNDVQLLDAVQPSEGVLIEFQDAGIGTPHNQQSWCPNLRESVTGEIGAAAA